MKIKDFEQLKKWVENGDETDLVFYSPNFYKNLNIKQQNEIVEILLKKGLFPVVKRRTFDYQGWLIGVLLPCNMEIFETEDF